MIFIQNEPLNVASFVKNYPEGSVERAIIKILSSSSATHSYNSIGELQFELKLRREIVQAARDLSKSKLAFRVFRKSFCNPQYWTRTRDGGFALKRGVKPSAAVRDIYQNSAKYGTECATAMLIVYYKALLETLGENAFDQIFPNIHLMNWHQIERELKDVGFMHPANDHLPGDRRYFANPDVDPYTPEWQGENVIDLGDGTYYGHGIGLYPAKTFIKLLNGNR